MPIDGEPSRGGRKPEIPTLREAEIIAGPNRGYEREHLANGEAGRKVADLCRTHGITEQTHYRWKAKYGGMELSEMQRLKQVEDENRRLKQIVAEQTLDIQALKAVVAIK